MKLTMAFLTLISSMALASPEHKEHKPVAMPQEFETLKKLVGTWEGTTKMGDKETPISVVYELTSAGTAITEKLGPGTPMEMVSVYHKNGKSLAMTHYCAVGNAPQMNLKKADDKSIFFEMTKPIGVSSMKEMHMHSIKLTLNSGDSLTQEWTNYENGKKKETAVFTFTRKK
jgi:hypothetical protein